MTSRLRRNDEECPNGDAEHPSGAKALSDFVELSGTTKVVPFQNGESAKLLLQDVKVVPFQNGESAKLLLQDVKAVPFQNGESARLFLQEVKQCPFKTSLHPSDACHD